MGRKTGGESKPPGVDYSPTSEEAVSFRRQCDERFTRGKKLGFRDRHVAGTAVAKAGSSDWVEEFNIHEAVEDLKFMAKNFHN